MCILQILYFVRNVTDLADAVIAIKAIESNILIKILIGAG
jgi:hypothetical protein